MFALWKNENGFSLTLGLLIVVALGVAAAIAIGVIN